MNQPKPFDCEYSPQFAELLSNLGISLALSTYQAGKVVMVSAVETDKLIQLPRTFPGAMGMAHSEERLAVANTNEVVVLKNEPSLASSYPTKPGVYDAMFIPRATYHTGRLALHDMEFINNRLVAVNTQFSALCEINSNSNFIPFWQPSFITQLMPEDRCHLNGMAVDDGQIKYLTALGSGNTHHSWRDLKMNGGILMEYPSGNIILQGLAMPHSPRVYDGEVYLLNSGHGELVKVNVAEKSYEVIVNLGGFARGMARCGDYLFIGVSKLRHNSKSFADLPIAKTSFAGIIAVYLPYKTIVGYMKYRMSVDEIYDVKVINALRPNVLSTDMEVHKQAYCGGDLSFWSQPQVSTENKQRSQTSRPSNINQQHAQADTKSYTSRLVKDVTLKTIKQQFPELIESNMVDTGDIKYTAVIVVLDNRPAAMALLSLTGQATCSIPSFVVLPEHEGRGVENYLVKQIDIVTDYNKLTWINRNDIFHRFAINA